MIHQSTKRISMCLDNSPQPQITDGARKGISSAPYVLRCSQIAPPPISPYKSIISKYALFLAGFLGIIGLLFIAAN